MKNKILVLHGPNLNRLGKREITQYGRDTLDEINQRLLAYGAQIGLEVVTNQSNIEGDLINQIHAADDWANGIVINAGAYTHTSIAIRDAIASINIPVIEVHLSNVYSREPFRHHSMISPVCKGVIAGFGWISYRLALSAMLDCVK